MRLVVVTEAAWTWLLFVMEVVGVAGMWFVGRRHWWGWLIVLGHSVPWLVYAIVERLPGFVAMTAMWWAMHAYNARRWFVIR